MQNLAELPKVMWGKGIPVGHGDAQDPCELQKVEI